MKQVLFSLLLICLAVVCKSQTISPNDLVNKAKSENTFKPVNFLNSSDRNEAEVPQELTDYQLFSLDRSSTSELLTSSSKAITFSLKKNERESFDLELVEIDLPLFLVKSGATLENIKYQGGKHYRGIVRGDANSIAAVSIFEGEVMALVSDSRSEGNWVLGKLENSEDYIFYNDPQIQDKFSLACKTEDSFEPYEEHEVMDNHGSRALTDCVGLYFEVDYDIYQDKGSSTTNVTNYVTGLYNQVATLYAAENINTNISEIVIWDQPSPYSSSSSSGMLNQFTGYRQGFNGDLAMLLSYQASGGIAYVNGLCSSNPDYSMSFSSINSTYQNVPTYSWSVMVVTHEFGHLFGSQHTHACVWNGNSTAIDGCYTTEGGCPNPGIPSNGGTIMSYCHLTSAGINLNNGFGPQPGNVIRTRVSNANCLQACGNPPPPPPACTDNEATLNITLDNYPGETTWTIKDASGATLYAGGPYSTANSLVSIDICEPDGCYDFTINDSYGDGICCGYGQGSYEVVFNGSVLISGGQFGNTETQQFCLSGGGSTPTCTDGIQNGDETGVDCGGSTCPPCATCNDGIQNGDETGVDCGGSTCPACPTCTDGVQNGDETGVDCGGSNCPPCSSCNDGIQNGDETGVDCGGSTCPACPTCTDGVQNGDETGVDCGGSNCPPCNSCNDGIQNGDETGVDCGGSTCPACPTCSDGIQNGDETGVDCGGSTCPPCNSGCTDVTISIVLDNYPGETTWNLKDGNGSTVVSGGPYGSAGSTINVVECLSDGCYDFTINDSYGDGICCAYGQGSYQVSYAGGTLASGGAFGSSETTNFCIGGGSTPTCTDGVQNGDETGVDCGGSNCPPCNSCNDGIQNGDETGVDCGGSNCPACPTCSDGIQNGDETGVDCGGSNCPACPTCSDGIQNGDETGVDCGGSVCPPCGGGGSSVLSAHYFESGWDGWSDGGSDCYRYNSSSRAYEGNYSIRLRDNSGVASAMTSPSYDLTPYNLVELEFYFYAYSMENGEDFFVRYYNGSSWSTIASYARGTDFENNTFYVVTLTLDAATYNFSSNAQFRFQCDASTNSDQIYIDAVTVTASSGAGLREDNNGIKTLRKSKGFEKEGNIVRISPNPSSDYITIDIYDEEEEIGNVQSIDIFDLMGRNILSMRQVDLLENVRINVSSLSTGAYIMRLNTDGEQVLTQKFQVIRQ